ILERDYAGLMEPLRLNQGAPLGYLFTLKFLSTLFGSSELALRLPSFVSSCFLLGAMVPLARCLFGPRAWLAIAATALSPMLVAYAAECKQYAVDALFTTLLLALLRFRGPGLAVLLAGILALVCSHPALFVVGGIALTLLWHEPRRRWPWLLSGVWGCTFILLFLSFLKNLGQNRYLTEFWAGKFAPFPPRNLGDFSWFPHHFFEMFDTPGGFSGPGYQLAGLAGVLFLLGMVRLWKREPIVAHAACGTMMLTLLASAVGKYPFGGRLLLFLVPILIIGVVEGLLTVTQLLRSAHPRLGFGLCLIVASGPVVSTGQQLLRPLHQEDVRGVWRTMPAREALPMIILPGAIPAVEYENRTGLMNSGSITMWQEVTLEQIQAIRGPVWVLQSHRKPTDEARWWEWFRATGHWTLEQDCPGAQLWRFTPRD
ncbi:MAG: hypothetical protein ACRCZF_20795, partial [Gemmataceae bacterium]